MPNTLETSFQINENGVFEKADRLNRVLTEIDKKFTDLGGSSNFGNRVKTTITDAEKLKASTDKLAREKVNEERRAAREVEAINNQTQKNILASNAQFEKQLEQQTRNRVREQNRAMKQSADDFLKNLKEVNGGGGGNGGGSNFGNGFVDRTFGANFGSAAFLGGLAGGAVIAGLGAVKSAISDITSEVEDLTGKSIKLAADFEEKTNSLAIFAGNVGNARKELNAIDKVALSTPGLKLADAETGYQRLRALNFEAKLSQNLIKGLGTQRVLSGADSGSVDRVITNLIQLSSGAGTAADVRQTIQSLPSLIPVFQRAFGTSDFGKINDLAKSNPDQFLNKFAEELAKAQTAQAGLNVSLEKGYDTLEILGRKFGEPILDPLKKDVVDLTGLLNENTSTAQNWGQRVADAIQGVSDAARGLNSANNASGGLLGRGALGLGRAFLGGATFGLSEAAIGTFQGFADYGRRQREAEEQKKAVETLTGGKSSIELTDLIHLNLGKISDAIKGTPSLKEKMEANRAADEIEKVKKSLAELTYKVAGDSIGQNLELEKAKIVLDARGDGLKIARETARVEIDSLNQQIALARDQAKAQIRNLSPDDLKAGKDLPITYESYANIAKLQNQIALTRINAQKQEEDAVKSLQKTYDSVFDSLNRKLGENNPFVSVFSEADNALKNLRENLKTLPPEMQAQAIAMQQQINSNALFQTRLDNRLDVFDLREQARAFRSGGTPKTDSPVDSDSFKKAVQNAILGNDALGAGSSALNRKSFGSYLASQLPKGAELTKAQQLAIYQQSQINAITQAGGNANDFITYFARQRQNVLGAIPDDNLSIQQKLDKQISIINSLNPQSDAEKSAADRKIIALAQNIDPSKLTDSERNSVARSFENEADRRSKYESAALAAAQSQNTISGQILAALTGGKVKLDPSSAVTIQFDGNGNIKASVVPTPTPKDTAAAAAAEYQPRARGSKEGLVNY